VLWVSFLRKWYREEGSLPDDFEGDVEDIKVEGILFQAFSLSDANQNNEYGQVWELR